jgi:Domain of unknown function (DUF4160)
MYPEPGGRHHEPHFHAWHAGKQAVYFIDPFRRAAGSLPVPQERLITTWALLHISELKENWARLERLETPLPIPPLG